MRELDVVALERDLPKHRLRRGDTGTIVHDFGVDDAYMVKFMDAAGHTIAVVEVNASDIRPLSKTELRELTEHSEIFSPPRTAAN